MTSIHSDNLIKRILRLSPIGLLFFSVLNNFDTNYIGLDYFSFNSSFILIFFCTLRKVKYFGFGIIFCAGLITDTVNGFPLGISSFSYMLLCIATSYLRSITLRPNIIKDWLFFLTTISIINLINYSILDIFFLIKLDSIYLFINNFFTFLFYLFFSYIFNIYLKLVMGTSYA
jgi:rod shape-determining protein MreD